MVGRVWVGFCSRGLVLAEGVRLVCSCQRGGCGLGVGSMWIVTNFLPRNTSRREWGHVGVLVLSQSYGRRRRVPGVWPSRTNGLGLRLGVEVTVHGVCTVILLGRGRRKRSCRSYGLVSLLVSFLNVFQWTSHLWPSLNAPGSLPSRASRRNVIGWHLRLTANSSIVM